MSNHLPTHVTSEERATWPEHGVVKLEKPFEDQGQDPALG